MFQGKVHLIPIFKVLFELYFEYLLVNNGWQNVQWINFPIGTDSIFQLFQQLQPVNFKDRLKGTQA
jgi:hypothetical protein